MARPKAKARRTAGARTNFRLPPALVARLDAWARGLNDGNPLGRQWTRTDLARECLRLGLERWGAAGLPPGAGGAP